VGFGHGLSSHNWRISVDTNGAAVRRLNQPHKLASHFAKRKYVNSGRLSKRTIGRRLGKILSAPLDIGLEIRR
jgi:hypothetical protein